MAQKPAIKDWLKDSYTIHGNSTSKSLPKSGNTFDTKESKVKAVAEKNTDMQKTTRQGNASGGGRSSISTSSPTNGGSKVSQQNGLMNGPNKGSGTKLKK